MEIWKNIEGYDGVFQISSEGRLKRISQDITRKGPWGSTVIQHVAGWVKGPEFKNERAITKRGGGYYEYHTFFKGKPACFDIHREVAKAFLPNPENLPTVNHKDGNKHNNRVENLEWMDMKNQMRHAVKLGLSNYSEERNRKISESRKKLRWYTDGTNEICVQPSTEIPPGWKPGRKPSRREREVV